MKILDSRKDFVSISHNALGDFEQWYLLVSDIHLDSAKCNSDLFFTHLDRAKERNAKIFIFGDLFDLMQGRNDRRGNKSSIRKEHLNAAYFDTVIQDIREKLQPYADHIVMISNGNHETSVIRHNEIDPISRLTTLMNYESEKAGQSPVHHGDYGGYVKFTFNKSKDANTDHYFLRWHHGYGGSAPVTKGAIQMARVSEYWPDADIVIMGHIHAMNTQVRTKERINYKGKVYNQDTVFLRSGTYKNAGEWEIEKGFAPPTQGGYWLRFYKENSKIKFQYIKTNE